MEPGQITLLLHEWSAGEPAASEKLFELVYLGATQQDIGQTAGRGVATDTNNNVYLFATAGSPYLPTKNSIAAPSGNDSYVAELSPTASTLLLGTYIGIGGGFTPNNNSLPIDAKRNCLPKRLSSTQPLWRNQFPHHAQRSGQNHSGCRRLRSQTHHTTTALRGGADRLTQWNGNTIADRDTDGDPHHHIQTNRHSVADRYGHLPQWHLHHRRCEVECQRRRNLYRRAYKRHV
jgi:hypothetical protein